LELLAFTIAEAARLPLPNICEQLLQINSTTELDFLKASKTTEKTFKRYLEQGGLPGISLFRNIQIRNEKFSSHLETLLNRDIRQIYPTTLLYDSLQDLLVYLANRQGRCFKWTEAARASQISRVTLKRVIFAFEALFLIRVVSVEGKGKPTIFLEDQGMASKFPLFSSPQRIGWVL